MSKFHGHHIFHTSNLTTMHLPHPTPWARDPQSAAGRGRAVGPPLPHEVERVVDSSRYFVLKITNGDRHLGPQHSRSRNRNELEESKPTATA